jgi:hypothetical protein
MKTNTWHLAEYSILPYNTVAFLYGMVNSVASLRRLGTHHSPLSPRRGLVLITGYLVEFNCGVIVFDQLQQPLPLMFHRCLP